MRRIRWTESAVADLEGIAAYLENRDPAAAHQITNRIYETAMSLSRMPYRGRAGEVPGTREMIVLGLPYFIIYTIRFDAVTISNIVHAAQRR